MSRAKRTRKQPARRPARTAARPSVRPTRSRRKPASARIAAAARPSSAGWSTLQIVWRPALAMATLPVRVYRVYRWAEAEQARAASV